jgi:hypothetical protein
MTVKLEIAENNLVIIRASEVLMRNEADDAKKQVFTIIERQGTINVLIVIEQGFSNLQAFVSWDDNHLDEFIQKNIKRMAIIGDLKWHDDAMLFFLSGLLPFTIEYFKFGQEELALAWLHST